MTKIPSDIRWLGRLEDVRCRPQEGKMVVSSITFVVLGEATFARLRKRGLRLLGHRYSVGALEEDRPNALCCRGCGSGHIESRCTAASPRCSLCKGDRHTASHRRPVDREGARLRRKGQPCTHDVAKCRNCRSPHFTQSDGCRVKKVARQLAQGWRPPPSPRRERGANAPLAPEAAPSEVRATKEGGEMEVDEGFEPASEEMEKGGRAGQTECTFSFVLSLLYPFSWRNGGRKVREPHHDGWVLQLRGWVLGGDGIWIYL